MKIRTLLLPCRRGKGSILETLALEGRISALERKIAWQQGYNAGLRHRVVPPPTAADIRKHIGFDDGWES